MKPEHALNIVNIQAAKTHLSRIVEEVAAGREVVLAKAGKPLVRLVPFVPATATRKGGQWRGRVWESGGCWEPDGDSLLEVENGLMNGATISFSRGAPRAMMLAEAPPPPYGAPAAPPAPASKKNAPAQP